MDGQTDRQADDIQWHNRARVASRGKIESQFETKSSDTQGINLTFCQLHFCVILFKLVLISHCYPESHRVNFFETRCSF